MGTTNNNSKITDWLSGNVLTILVVIVSTVMGYGRLSTRVDDMSVTLQKIVDKVDKIDERTNQNQFFVIQKITELDVNVKSLSERVTAIELRNRTQR